MVWLRTSASTQTIYYVSTNSVYVARFAHHFSRCQCFGFSCQKKATQRLLHMVKPEYTWHINVHVCCNEISLFLLSVKNSTREVSYMHRKFQILCKCCDWYNNISWLNFCACDLWKNLYNFDTLPPNNLSFWYILRSWLQAILLNKILPWNA